MYLVWLDYKCLGYMGWETVLLTREKVNMMMFSDCFDQRATSGVGAAAACPFT